MHKSIIIADDHPIFRLGLRTAIETSGEYHLEAEASNGPELLEYLKSRPCDLAMIDIKMSEDEDGITLLQKIKENYPDLKVVIISQYYKKSLIERAITLGVDGYITKEDILESIIFILKHVFAGEKFFSSKVQQVLMDEYTVDGIKMEKLTDRETEILKLFVAGYKRKEISDELDIAAVTVDFHHANIKAKLNADNLAELIKKAKELDL